MQVRRWWRRRAPLPLFLVTLLVVSVACGDSDDSDTTASTAAGSTATATRTSASPPLTGKVAVFAASSLTEAFRAIGDAFKGANPDVSIEFNFASSSALATQIEQAAPADVFASADMPQMQRLADQSLIEGMPATFARNVPVLVVPADNRAGVETPKDIARAGVKLVLAAPDVPIGNYARQIIDRLAADPAYGARFKDAALKNIVSNEANVRAVLTKVELGEADAGIVYRTDALLSGGKVKVIGLPDGVNVIATYPIAVVSSSRNKRAAAAFVAFVRSPEGQAILEDAGLGPGD